MTGIEFDNLRCKMVNEEATKWWLLLGGSLHISKHLADLVGDRVHADVAVGVLWIPIELAVVPRRVIIHGHDVARVVVVADLLGARIFKLELALRNVVLHLVQ